MGYPATFNRSGIPNVEDNLAASDTPITVEPQAGDLRARRIRQLVAQGMTPAQAAAAADRDLAHLARKRELMAGGMSEEQATVAAGREMVEAGFPEPAPAQPAVATPQPQAEEPLDLPNEFGDLVYDPVTKRVRQRPKVAPAPQAPAMAMTVPGPRTLDGRDPRDPRALTTPQEVEAYETRDTEELSQRDRDMAARGYAPVVTPQGVTYMLSAMPGGLDGVGSTTFPGGAGRAGAGRPDLEAKGYVPEERQMPDGRRTMVYVPGPQMRAEQAADLADRQAAYRAKKARMDAERAEARDRWRATAILAGGSHNLNSGNRWIANALYGMNPAEQQAALRYMLPGGQLHAAVDARNAERAGAMAQSAMTAFLTNNPAATPEQRAMMQAKLDEMNSGKPAAEASLAYRNRPDIHPAELQYADDYVTQLYSASWGFMGTSSDFTIDEQQAVVDHLVNDRGYTPAKAQSIVDEIARKRNAQSWAGSPTRGSPAPEPTPGGGAI